MILFTCGKNTSKTNAASITRPTPGTKLRAGRTSRKKRRLINTGMFVLVRTDRL